MFSFKIGSADHVCRQPAELQFYLSRLPHLIPFGTEHFWRVFQCQPPSTSAQHIYIKAQKTFLACCFPSSLGAFNVKAWQSLAQIIWSHTKETVGRWRNINHGFSFLAHLYWLNWIEGNSIVDQDGNLIVGIVTSGTWLRVLLGLVGFDFFQV